MRATRSITNKRVLSRLALRLLQSGVAAVFFGTVLHHVYTQDFKPLAALCIPVLAVFFTFTSLLYIRGRSLARGRSQFRTLFAAERSMQATICYLAGIVVGTSFYGLLQYFPFSFDPSQPTLTGLWLLVFLAPYALMQTGLLMFLRAAWIVGPQFLWGVSSYQIWRRISQEP
jgi:hypothetical protein